MCPCVYVCVSVCVSVSVCMTMYVCMYVCVRVREKVRDGKGNCVQAAIASSQFRLRQDKEMKKKWYKAPKNTNNISIDAKRKKTWPTHKRFVFSPDRKISEITTPINTEGEDPYLRSEAI